MQTKASIWEDFNERKENRKGSLQYTKKQEEDRVKDLTRSASVCVTNECKKPGDDDIKKVSKREEGQLSFHHICSMNDFQLSTKFN